MSKICANCGVLNRSELIRCKKCNRELAGGGLKAWEQGGYQKRESVVQSSSNIPLNPNLQQASTTSQEANQDIGQMIDQRFQNIRQNPSANIFVEDYIPAAKQPASLARQRKYGAILAFSLIVLLLGAGFYYLSNRDNILLAQRQEQAIQQLLFEGETHLNNRNFADAALAFQTVTEQSKAPEIAADAARKLVLAQKKHVSELVDKARDALQKNRILTADGNNAIMFITQARDIDPEDASVLEMQHILSRHLTLLAASAEESGQSNDALSYYEMILLLDAEDTYALAKIEEVLLENQVKRTEVASTERKGIQREATRSTTPKKRVKKTPPKRTTLENNVRTKTAKHTSTSQPRSNTVKTNYTQPAAPPSRQQTADTQSQPANTPPVSAKLSDKTLKESSHQQQRSSSATASATGTSVSRKEVNRPLPVVTIGETDQGKKEQIAAPRPSIPTNWNHRGYAIVKAQCTVNGNGIVEAVKILSIFSPDTPSTQHERLKQLSEETFRKYRYRPATRGGQPVRFNVTETITYR